MPDPHSPALELPALSEDDPVPESEEPDPPLDVSEELELPLVVSDELEPPLVGADELDGRGPLEDGGTPLLLAG